jgi:hypothetical protein
MGCVTLSVDPTAQRRVGFVYRSMSHESNTHKLLGCACSGTTYIHATQQYSTTQQPKQVRASMPDRCTHCRCRGGGGCAPAASSSGRSARCSARPRCRCRCAPPAPPWPPPRTCRRRRPRPSWSGWRARVCVHVRGWSVGSVDRCRRRGPLPGGWKGGVDWSVGATKPRRIKISRVKPRRTHLGRVLHPRRSRGEDARAAGVACVSLCAMRGGVKVKCGWVDEEQIRGQGKQARHTAGPWAARNDQATQGRAGARHNR